MRFSDRIGATKPELNLQLESISTELRNSLWNLLFGLYDSGVGREGRWREIVFIVAKHFRKSAVDELPLNSWELRNWLKEYFFELDWYEVYNLLEFLVASHAVLKFHTSHTKPA